jgi:hypothetical protein
VPFTLSQDLKDVDERESIPCKGPKCLKIKHFEPSGGTQKLAMLAYRDNSKVVLMCSTTERVVSWTLRSTRINVSMTMQSAFLYRGIPKSMI